MMRLELDEIGNGPVIGVTIRLNSVLSMLQDTCYVARRPGNTTIRIVTVWSALGIVNLDRLRLIASSHFESSCRTL